MGHDHDLKVDGKLKVEKDAHFEDDVKIDDNLKVRGRCDFGDVTATQLTSKTAAVTCNGASGLITLFPPAVAADLSSGYVFTVYNKEVNHDSVVLLTPLVLTNAGDDETIYSFTLRSIVDGSFVVRVNAINTAVGQPPVAPTSFKLCYLVC